MDDGDYLHDDVHVHVNGNAVDASTESTDRACCSIDTFATQLARTPENPKPATLKTPVLLINTPPEYKLSLEAFSKKGLEGGFKRGLLLSGREGLQRGLAFVAKSKGKGAYLLQSRQRGLQRGPTFVIKGKSKDAKGYP